MYIPRHLTEVIAAAGKFFPVILLTGPRQVGKTALLRHMAEPERKYVTLDDAALRLLAREDPRAFLERFSPPVLIDEIQYAPELLTAMKIVVDERRFKDPENAKGMYWLTGSQRFPLMAGVSESLAGRIGIFELSGFSQPELDGKKNVPFTPDREFEPSAGCGTRELFRRIWKGCYPEVVGASPQEREFFYSGYVNTYLERDIRNLTKVHDLDRFFKFLCSCAAGTGQLLSCSEMARDAGIDVKTAQGWLSILTSSRIAYLLPPYAGSRVSRLVKTPKLYLLDTGLCAHLTRWPTPETLEAGAMSGAFFETWCVSEILKSYWNSGTDNAPVSFYRDNDQREVDLLIETPEGIHPVEFKKSATPKPDDLKNFGTLERLGRPLRRGALICCSPEVIPLPNRNAVSIPASLI